MATQGKGGPNRRAGESGPMTPFATGQRFTDERKKLLIAEYEKHGNLGGAAARVGVSLATVRKHRHEDPEFDEAVDAARRRLCARLEEEAIRRAVQGIPKGKYYLGQQIATEQEYSDGLLQTLLKRHEPAYRDRIQVDQTVTPESSDVDPAMLARLSPETRQELRSILEKAQAEADAVEEEEISRFEE